MGLFYFAVQYKNLSLIYFSIFSEKMSVKNRAKALFSLFRLDVVLPVGSWPDSLAEEDYQNDDRQDVRRDLQVNGWQAGNAWKLVPDDTQALREAKEEGGQHSADWVVAAEDHGSQGHETLPGNSGN